jgi:predicted DNA-binding transcriptional regulator AlpA
LPKTIHRLRRASELLGEPPSTIWAKVDPDNCMYDPDHPRPIHMGPKSVGFDADEILAYQFLKIAKRDEVPAAERDGWVAQRVIEEHARQELIAEAKASLTHKHRPYKRGNRLGEAADATP